MVPRSPNQTLDWHAPSWCRRPESDPQQLASATERHTSGDVCLFEPLTGRFVQVFPEQADRLYVADVFGDWLLALSKGFQAEALTAHVTVRRSGDGRRIPGKLALDAPRAESHPVVPAVVLPGAAVPVAPVALEIEVVRRGRLAEGSEHGLLPGGGGHDARLDPCSALILSRSFFTDRPRTHRLPATVVSST
jgi:hypothetical protein